MSKNNSRSNLSWLIRLVTLMKQQHVDFIVDVPEHANSLLIHFNGKHTMISYRGVTIDSVGNIGFQVSRVEKRIAVGDMVFAIRDLPPDFEAKFAELQKKSYLSLTCAQGTCMALRKLDLSQFATPTKFSPYGLVKDLLRIAEQKNSPIEIFVMSNQSKALLNEAKNQVALVTLEYSLVAGLTATPTLILMKLAGFF